MNVILFQTLFLDFLDNNNLMRNLLLWLFFWVDKSLFIENMNNVIQEKGSVPKCIRTIRNK